MADRVSVFFNFDEITALIKVFDNLFSCSEPVKPPVNSAVFVDEAAGIHNIDFFETVAFAHFIVVRVVGRRYLDETCSEFPVNI